MGQFIDWSHELSVGIEEIDGQHQVLVELLNEIHAAIQQGRTAEVTQDILDRLDEYARIHFAVEESLMRVLHYPEYEAHKQEHDRLMTQLNELRQKWQAGKGTVGFELAQLLKEWLVRHILDIDKRYTAHFLARGIQPKLAEGSWTKRFWRSLRGD